MLHHKKIGLLGGGQLGRMTLAVAQQWDLPIHILEPDPEAPCATLTPFFTLGSLSDYDTVLQWGKPLDIISIEIENVNTQALAVLAAEGKHVYPQPHLIALIQDKGAQKDFYARHGFPTSDFALTHNAYDAHQYLVAHPDRVFFQKMRTGGYDGRGVKRVSVHTPQAELFQTPSLIEAAVSIQKELSVIVARNAHGEVQSFPVVEMGFNPHYNLVDFQFAPADIASDLAHKARELAEQLTVQLGIVGLLAVEMFLDQDNHLLINEIAPRPHNSGHQTIEGNITSQFEQFLRAILNLPLGDTSARGYSAMLNLLGAEGQVGVPHYVGLEEALQVSGVYPHIYGKRLTKPGRKMGHLTVIADGIVTLKAHLSALRDTVRVLAR